MIDLSSKPFHLDERAVHWVRDTIAAMTLEEKVGQLFINLNVSFDEAYLDTVVSRYRVGSLQRHSILGDRAERYSQRHHGDPLIRDTRCDP